LGFPGIAGDDSRVGMANMSVGEALIMDLS